MVDPWRLGGLFSPFRWQYPRYIAPGLFVLVTRANHCNEQMIVFSVMQVFIYFYPSEMHDSISSACMPESSWAISRDFRKYINALRRPLSQASHRIIRMEEIFYCLFHQFALQSSVTCWHEAPPNEAYVV